VTVEGLVIDGGEALNHYLNVRESQEQRLRVIVTCDREEFEAQTFVASREARRWATPGWPVCLSYVDCVLQGYLREFGEGGLDRFVASTEGWERTFVDDRDRPLYPRHVKLKPRERCAIDARLRRLLVTFSG
jgi:hypothetical protein